MKTGDASGIRTGQAYEEAVQNGDIKTTYTLLEGTQHVGQEAVPTEVAARIIEKRDAISILRRGGAQILQASSNALVVPIEYTSPDVFVLTTEGAAYDVTTANPMDKLTATIYMYTKSVAVSLQLLEDSAFDIEAWWGRRLGRAWGLTENDFGLVGGGSGAPQGLAVGGTVAAVTAAGTNVLTAAEIVSLYGKLPFEYRDNVSWVFAQATEAAVRGLTATNTYPFVGTGGTQGGVGNIGIAQGNGWLVDPSSKVFNSGSMPAMTTGLVSVLCGNIEAGYAIAERRGLTVFRDPYTLSANGKVNIHAYFREGGGVVNATAIQGITQHT
jgi:HK97 family phage major capsid protein